MSFLSQVTPVILTFNEENNIERCLAGLSWAKDIVVVDSGSTDATEAICRRFPQVRWFVRSFDNHAAQWTHAVHETGVATDWVLALDADYMVGEDAAREIDALDPAPGLAGYWLNFVYAVYGKPLRSGIYPPVRALYRRDAGQYVQDGHTQRLQLTGETGTLSARLTHDDRKSLTRWVSSQIAYAQLEASKLENSQSGLRGWLRTRTPFAPFAMGAYCLIIRLGLFDGPAGWLYALQRIVAEGLISAAYLERSLKRTLGK